MQQMPANRAGVRLLWAVVLFLSFIGMVVASRRTIVLLHPGSKVAERNPAAALDAHFEGHRVLTLIHILPGILFMVLGPLQFVPGLRAKHPQIHRWSGRVFLASSAILGVAGLTMAAGPTIGGFDEKAAVFVFGTLLLLCLAKAFRHALRQEFLKHREWMIRGYAIGLAVAAVRPIMGGFFAAAIARGRSPDPHSFFGTAFWIGFTLSAVVAELWIRYTRPATPGPSAVSLGTANNTIPIGDSGG